MKKTIIIAAALVAMTACNKSLIEVSPAEEFGTISLGVTTDTEMVVTKGITTSDNLNGYNITLKKDGNVVDGWPKEFGEIDDADWKVPAGSYSVYVENLTVEEAYATDKGTVRVSGETEVTVTAGMSTSCKVECKPQNSMVSFMYSPDFDTVFDEPTVKVNADAITVNGYELEARELNMTVGTSHEKDNAAYFEVATLTWTLTAKLGQDTKTYTKEFTTQQAKWTQVKFTTGSTDGQINVTITVDGQITETHTITATIDPIGGTVTQE